jgi:hypothetical protein
MSRILALALAGLVAACASVSSPPEQDYTLSVEAPVQPLHAVPSASIAVGAARVPDLYDKPQLVVRASENRVRVLEQHRWAEPLRAGIARVVAADLGRLLGTVHTTSYPRAEARDTGYRVALDVQRFDATVGQGADVDIAWHIHKLPDGPLRDGRTTTHEPASGDYEALVAAQSRALAAVSRDIAQAIAAMK